MFNEATTEDADGEGAMQQKQRFVWSPELHKRFEAAVGQLGIEAAKPQAISQLMGLPGENAPTRQNIKSHLQKYRLLMKKKAAVAEGGAPEALAAAPAPATRCNKGTSSSSGRGSVAGGSSGSGGGVGGGRGTRNGSAEDGGREGGVVPLKCSESTKSLTSKKGAPDSSDATAGFKTDSGMGGKPGIKRSQSHDVMVKRGEQQGGKGGGARWSRGIGKTARTRTQRIS